MLEKNKKIGLVGTSNVGKSTFISVLYHYLKYKDVAVDIKDGQGHLNSIYKNLREGSDIPPTNVFNDVRFTIRKSGYIGKRDLQLEITDYSGKNLERFIERNLLPEYLMDKNSFIFFIDSTEKEKWAEKYDKKYANFVNFLYKKKDTIETKKFRTAIIFTKIDELNKNELSYLYEVDDLLESHFPSLTTNLRNLFSSEYEIYLSGIKRDDSTQNGFSIFSPMTSPLDVLAWLWGGIDNNIDGGDFPEEEIEKLRDKFTRHRKIRKRLDYLVRHTDGDKNRLTLSTLEGYKDFYEELCKEENGFEEEVAEKEERKETIDEDKKEYEGEKLEPKIEEPEKSGSKDTEKSGRDLELEFKDILSQARIKVNNIYTTEIVLDNIYNIIDEAEEAGDNNNFEEGIKKAKSAIEKAEDINSFLDKYKKAKNKIDELEDKDVDCEDYRRSLKEAKEFVEEGNIFDGELRIDKLNNDLQKEIDEAKSEKESRIPSSEEGWIEIFEDTKNKRFVRVISDLDKDDEEDFLQFLVRSSEVRNKFIKYARWWNSKFGDKDENFFSEEKKETDDGVVKVITLFPAGLRNASISMSIYYTFAVLISDKKVKVVRSDNIRYLTDSETKKMIERTLELLRDLELKSEREGDYLQYYLD